MMSSDSIKSSLPFCMLLVLILASCRDFSFKRRKASAQLSQAKEQLFDADAAREVLARFGDADTTKDPKSIGSATAYVYQASGHMPVWVAEEGLTDEAQLLLTDLDSLRNDGIAPDRYKLDELKRRFEQLRHGGDLDNVLAFDTACTRAYLQASHDLLFGVLVSRKVDSLWYHANDSVWAAPRALAALTDGKEYVHLAAFRSNIPTYSRLREEYLRYKALEGDTSLKNAQQELIAHSQSMNAATAVIRKELPWLQAQEGDSLSPAMQLVRGGQEYFGLNPTGRLDSATTRRLTEGPEVIESRIAINMERLRWLPRNFENQYVLVNVPLMELFYRKDGSDAFHMRVVVGKTVRQTPALNAMMANVVFSPSWGVPPTILKKDVLPGLSKSGAGYLRRKGLRVYTKSGKPVDASVINAGNYRKYMLKQPPGEDNALGDVKFNLPNPWDIYLHDTPHREDFAKRYRAKSSGCIRVEKPREFAEFILRDIEGKDRFDQLTIDSIIQTRKTRWEILKNKIPVHIVYLTALEDSTGSHVRLVQDIYGRDSKVLAMLDAK